jgi:hypothetical protein
LRIVAFLPTPDELFPLRDASIDDLRALQENPVYQNSVQRLRGEAYVAAMTKQDTCVGLQRALEILGFSEFDVQKSDEDAKAEREGTKLASDIGFQEED